MRGKSTRSDRDSGRYDDNIRDTGEYPVRPLSETTWRILILASVIIVIALTVFSLTHGITTIFMHFYYFPIILLSYHYRKRGFLLSVLLSLAYFASVVYFQSSNVETLEGAFIRVIIFIGIAALVTYLSEQLVRSHDALKKANAIQESSIQNANVIMMLLDARGIILLWNKAAERISGYTAREVVGNNQIWKLLYPEKTIRDEITGRITRIIAENNFFENLETSIQTKSGEQKIISWNTRGLPRDEGDEARFIAIGVDITDRRLAEREKDKLAAIVESSDDAIYGKSLDGNIISWNTGAERLYGYTAAEAVGRPMSLIVPPDRSEEISSIIQRLLRGERIHHYETERIAKNGRRITISLTVSPIRNTHGAVIGMSAIARDITDKKRADEELARRHRELVAAYEQITEAEEEIRDSYEQLARSQYALKESEIRYRELFERMSSGVVIYRAVDDGRNFLFVDINRSAEQIDDIHKEDILGKKVTEVFPRIEEFGLLDVLRRVYVSGVAERLPVSRYEDERIIGWRENFVYRLPSKEVVAIYDDVTRRKKMETELLTAAQNLKKAQEMGQIGNWDWDIKGNILHWSDEVYRIFGVDRNFVPSYTGIAQMIHPEDKPKNDDKIGELLSIADIGEFEIRIVRPDGEIRQIYQSAEVSRNERGEAVRIFGIIQDITERKKMEDALRNAKEDLEMRVRQRTEDLVAANQMLAWEVAERKKAEEQIQASLKEKEVLLKEIHHRVKNNLQIVASLFNLQARYITDTKVLDAVRESQNRVRAMALVHERIYRSEDISTIDLSDYIRFLTTQLYRFYGISEAKVRLLVTIPEIHVDIDTAIPVGLIMNELVSNALKHGFPDGKKGEIRIDGSQTGNIYHFVVSDTGIGIREGFDWKNAPSLGLRLVISLVEQLSGTMELVPGPGTTFRISVKKKGS